jgi:hypothetical protein
MAVIYDWIEKGLGRDVEMFDGGGQTVYNGFVNKITCNFGAVSVSRGPLVNIANRVSAMYVPIIDETVAPPILGQRTETTIAEDTISQAKYGIVEKVLSIGNALDVDADSIRDLYLAENKDPESTQQVSMGGGGGDIGLTLECSGYIDWLELFVFNDVTTPLSVELTTKILSILTAEQAVNGIFSTNVSGVDFNGVLTSSYEAENRTAMAIIKAILAHGDINDARWLFGVYANRMVHYSIMPSTVEYLHTIRTRNQEITRPDESKVEPWSVLPGKWLFMPDLLPLHTDPDELRLDPRALFIESVTYTAPYGLQINGAKVNTLNQRLARLGLSGIS